MAMWKMSRVILAFAAVVSSGCAGPMWAFDLTLGQQIATSQSRPMLLYFADFTTSNHREMDRTIFSNPAVSKEMRGFANTALTYQWGPAPKRYGVSKPHVIIVCKPDGTEVDRLSVDPPPAPDAFAAWLRNAHTKAVPPPPATSAAK